VTKLSHWKGPLNGTAALLQQGALARMPAGFHRECQHTLHTVPGTDNTEQYECSKTPCQVGVVLLSLVAALMP
jgi:hypothetical protein